MSKNRRRIDRDTAEQLLRGASAGGLDGNDPLLGRLAAAAAPPFPYEFAGEREALAGFRVAAHLDPSLRPRRPSMIKTALAKLLTLKAAAVLAGVSAGGVALAASTGALPNPLDHNPFGTSASAEPTGKPSAGPGGANGSPSPSLVGLCHAYLAGAGADHGKALDSPAFTVLITTAGGKEKVDVYCTNLLAGPSGDVKPDQAGSRPTGAPTSHSPGAPTARPTPTKHAEG
jgi:hypothetical protein